MVTEEYLFLNKGKLQFSLQKHGTYPSKGTVQSKREVQCDTVDISGQRTTTVEVRSLKSPFLTQSKLEAGLLDSVRV